MIPEISVIIPIYNTALYLDICLRSVVNQSFKNIEILCINDGSTDNSLEILNKFAKEDNRIKIFSFEKASGSAGFPRNFGIENATGKYVMFLDSDDYFDLTLLEKLHTKAITNNCDLVLCDNYKVISETNQLSTSITELNPDFIPAKDVFSHKDIPSTIFQVTKGAPWNKFILLETIKNNNLKFQTNTPSLDDMYFINLVLVLSKRISIVNEHLIYYRVQRLDSQTYSIDKNKASIFIAFSNLNDFLIKNDIYDTVKYSLQNWTLATFKWWLNLIKDYDAYCELFNLYKNDYFKKLLLDEIDITTLNTTEYKFYNEIKNGILKEPLINTFKKDLPIKSNIALYGAGHYGSFVYSTLKTQNDYNIKLWCDKNYQSINDSNISSPEELLTNELDAIIIAVYDDKIVESIKKDFSKINVKVKHIYQFSDYFWGNYN